ncbi:MAG: hypothetical protein II604_00860, partial [Bacteroidales bacterium]|nr:hypothetical protein [Bacteroidales bacterium]
MANKWAIASGNWNATATWNDNSIPVNGDVVYTNGYTVTLNVDPNQPQTILTNGLCEDTQGSGGSFILQPAVAILTVKELKQVGINQDGNLTNNGEEVEEIPDLIERLKASDPSQLVSKQTLDDKIKESELHNIKDINYTLKYEEPTPIMQEIASQGSFSAGNTLYSNP